MNFHTVPLIKLLFEEITNFINTLCSSVLINIL